MIALFRPETECRIKISPDLIGVCLRIAEAYPSRCHMEVVKVIGRVFSITSEGIIGLKMARPPAR